MTPSVTDADRLIAREHAQPHAYLGAHPDGDGGRSSAHGAPPPLPCPSSPARASPSRSSRSIPAASSRAGSPRAQAAARLPLRGRLRRRRHGHRRRPLPLPADGRRARPAPGRRGPPRGAVGAPRRARARARRRCAGTAFAVWAPAARSVSVVGDFNFWDGRIHPMRSLGSSGIWELFLPGVERRRALQVRDPHPRRRDPPEGRPDGLRDRAAAQDGLGRARARARVGRRGVAARRAARASALQGPMSIYEVHLGSWRLNPLEDNRSLTYLELADELAAYARDMGFTHIELLPVMAHPFTGSWGYQVTSYFAPTPRFGSPDDFREFVDRLHQNGLGVILDWVPAHFPRDDFALARFDGTALYEHADPRRGAHPDWGTLVFNYGRTRSATSSSPTRCSGCAEYHADGIRVDAVASMLYLDYSREAGEWVPNEYGGNEDLEAVGVPEGAQRGRLRARAGRRSPPPRSRRRGRASRARPTSAGSGFGFKWNMGWMHDTLAYFQHDPIYRRYHHHELTFQPRVRVHGELHPAAVARRGRARQGLAAEQDAGRPLAEAARTCARCTPTCGRTPARSCCSWARSSPRRPSGARSARSTGTCSRTPSTPASSRSCAISTPPTRDEPALWEMDFDGEGFWWTEANAADDNVIAFARRTKDSERVALFVGNFSPVPRARTTGSASRAAGAGARRSTPTSSYYGGSDVGNLGGVEAEADGLARPAVLGRGHAAAAGRAVAGPGGAGTGAAARPVVG